MRPTGNHIRISAKHLGALALPGFCARCFWLQMQCGWKLPFQIFPGIFSTIDSHVKQVVGAHYAAHGRLPAWLGDWGAPIRVPHWSKFCWLDSNTNVLLTGAPDEMCRRANGSLAILDYKTAKLTPGQDALAPLYEVQLCTYAWLAARLGMGQTDLLALVYCEPVSGVGDCDWLTLCGTDGFDLHFTAKIVPVDVRPDIVPPLLTRVRKIIDRPQPPVAGTDCENCEWLERLLALTTS